MIPGRVKPGGPCLNWLEDRQGKETGQVTITTHCDEPSDMEKGRPKARAGQERHLEEGPRELRLKERDRASLQEGWHSRKKE